MKRVWFPLLLLVFGFLHQGTGVAENLPANITRIASQEKLCALTFDAHDSEKAPQTGVKEILKILKRNHIKGTFFVTGNYLELEPEIVKRIIKNGNEVGNHTFDHRYLSLKSVTKEQIQNELQITEAIFEKRYHHKMAAFWRAPYGRFNQAILKWAKEAGFQHIGWTVDMLDWISDPAEPGYLDGYGLLRRFDSTIDRGAAGYIFLLHLNAKRSTNSLDTVLQEMIDYGRANGYRFVTVSQLIKAGESKEKATIHDRKKKFWLW